MGANQFKSTQSAKTADEAFRVLVERARADHGRYPDPIGSKNVFLKEQPEQGETPIACVNRCMGDQDHWSEDKDGPAACVDGGPDPELTGLRIFHFFGWVAS